MGGVGYVYTYTGTLYARTSVGAYGGQWASDGVRVTKTNIINHVHVHLAGLGVVCWVSVGGVALQGTVSIPRKINTNMYICIYNNMQL